jgi:CRISPR-associated protein Csh1
MIQKINHFFSEFVDFFDNDAKKAVFLEGVLVQKLLNIQRLPEVSNAQPGKEPFRPRLKGLKLDEKQVKKLLPEIQNKLEEYGKNYYRTLESIISKYFISAGNRWKISNDEISFYFVLGMNLSYIFKIKKESSDGDEENE